jgi:predicted nucleic acid-binding protein
MVLIDSDIPMYMVGAPHRHKADAERALERLVATGERLVTDVEALQEILHRYVAIDRRAAIQPAFDAILGVVDDVLAVERSTVERADRRDSARGRLVRVARRPIDLRPGRHRRARRVRVLSRDGGDARVQAAARRARLTRGRPATLTGGSR